MLGRIRFGATHKYLGITRDRKFSLLPHVKEVSAKAKKLFGNVVRLSRPKYGASSVNLRILYNTVFEPNMSNGYEVWAHCGLNAHVKRVLRSCQRTV